MRALLLIAFCCLFLISGASAQDVDGIQDLPTDSDSLQARMDLIMDPATKQIDITTYLLKADQVGLTLIAGLADAAKRGVAVRLVVDWGIKKNLPGLVEYLTELGVQIRWHNAPEHFFKQPWNIGRIIRANHRMHEKMFLINGRKAVIGDKNYTEKFFHISLRGAARSMRGKEAYLEGPSVQLMQDHFEEVWSSKEVTPVKVKPLAPDVRVKVEFLLNPYREWLERRKTRANGRWLKKLEAFSGSEWLADTAKKTETSLVQILQQIESAPPGTKIMIENSYFVLFPELEASLKKAIANGNEIHVVLNSPEVADQRLIAEALRQDLPRMLDMGLYVHLNDDANRTTHAKLVVIGDKVIIGSANFDPRSYRTNSEGNMMMTSPGLAQQYWDRFDAQNPLRRNLIPNNSCAKVYSSKTGLEFMQKGPVLDRLILQFIRGQL